MTDHHSTDPRRAPGPVDRLRASRWTIPAAAWLAYVAALPLLRTLLGSHAGIAAFGPALITGWYGGALAGGLAGLATIPVTALVTRLLDDTAGGDVLSAASAGGAAAMALGGIAVGYVRQLNRQLSSEIAERRRAETERRERDARLTLVNDIARSMRGEQSAWQTIRRTVAALHDAFPQFRVAYSTLDDEGRLVMQYALGPDQRAWPDATATGIRLPPDCLQTLDRGELVPIADTERDVAVRELGAALRAGGTRALLDAPIRPGDVLAGLLSLDAQTPHPWTAHEQATLREVAEFLALALADDAARRRLVESEAKFRALATSSPNGIAMLQPHGVVFTNTALEKVTGYDGDELRRRTPAELLSLVAPDVREALRARMAARFSGELRGESTVTIAIESRSGQRRWIDVRSTTIEIDGTPTIVVTAADITDRQAAADATRQSELKFRTLAENSPAATALVRGRRALYVNPELERMSGYTRDELLAMDLGNLLHADDLAAIRRRGSRPGRAVGRFEVRMVTKTREVRWLDLGASPIVLDGHRTTLLTAVDVTDRRRFVEEIRASEARLQVLLDHYVDGIGVMVDGAVAYANPTVCRMFGYTAEQLMGLEPTRFIVEHQRDRVLQRIRALAQGAPPYPSEYEAVRKDGTTFPMEVLSRPITYDGKPALLTTMRDLSERHAAEQAVRDSERRFRSLFEQAPIGIALGDADSRLVQVNAAFCAMLGYEADELIGKTWDDITHPDDVDGRRTLSGVSRRDSIVRLERRYLRKDGEVVEAETTVSVARDPDGGLGFSVGMVQDVTEKRTLEERLRQAERLESVGELAGGVAHNFNNALTAIIGYSELLGRRFDHDREHDGLKDVAQIQRVAEHSASLTRQLLTFSRRELVRPSVFSLNTVVEATSALLGPLIGEPIRLRVRLDRTLRAVRADRSQMEQVLTHLVLNARDAMPVGGTLTIETDGVEVDRTVARSHPDARSGQYVRLTVSDTGLGMDHETVRRIFDPFFTTKEPGEGVGLGLAMVHGAIRQAGGFIVVNSEPGHGTTLQLHLPVHEEGEERDERTPATRPEETVPRRR